MLIKSLKIEKNYPFVGSSLLTVLLWVIGFNVEEFLDLNILLSIAITTAFLITSLLLFSNRLKSGSSKEIIFLKRIDKYSGLMNYLRNTIISLFLLLINTLCLIKWPERLAVPPGSSLWLYLTLYSTLSTVRSVKCLKPLYGISPKGDGLIE